jgi:transposase-like protein
MMYIPSHAGRPRSLSKEQFWRKTLRQFHASGQGVRRFCRTRRICSSSFYRWRQTLNRRDVASDPGTPSPPVFLPVQVTARETSRIEIVLGGGRRVRLSGPVDPAALEQVLLVLSGMGQAREGPPC